MKDLGKELTNKIVKTAQEKKKQFVYSIDWLTINIRLHDPADIRIVLDEVYSVKRERGTNVFENVRDFYNTRDELIFTIVSNPYSSIIKPDFAQLQISNKWLYVGNLEKLLYKIFFHSNFEYVAISRIDICADFYSFVQWDDKNNCYLSPAEFIQWFATGKVKKVNPSKFTLWGKTDDYYNRYHCLNVGDSQSVHSWKLYNKSKEMQDGVPKKYVVNKWERDLLNYNAGVDVWRLEVSIKDTNKITMKKDDINLVHDLQSWLQKYPYFFNLFTIKKWVFKDEYGRYIDFLKNPKEVNGLEMLSTNLTGKLDYSPTMKDKQKLITSLINIINKADTPEMALEYIEKIKEYIQEEDYYYIFQSKGYSIDILYSYFVYKFDPEKLQLTKNS